MAVYKKCRKCMNNRSLVDFYANSKWKDELYRDIWCKKCVSIIVIDEETFKSYMKINRREYKDGHWGMALSKAKDALKKKHPDLTGDKKERKLRELTKNWAFKLMNTSGYYTFIDDIMEYEENRKKIKINESDYESNVQIKEYNKKWRGHFTENDIEYLENYIAGLEKDFDISNASHMDYACKVAKASLAMDNAFADMQQGLDGADKRYAQMRNVFDSLSQSSKFAEKTRSNNDKTGFGSLGELIKEVETQGFLNKPVQFEKDDIDLIVSDFKYLLASVGEEI